MTINDAAAAGTGSMTLKVKNGTTTGVSVKITIGAAKCRVVASTLTHTVPLTGLTNRFFFLTATPTKGVVTASKTGGTGTNCTALNTQLQRATAVMNLNFFLTPSI